MAEQLRSLSERRVGGPSGLADPFAASEEFGGMANVNGDEVPVAGMTLGEIRQRLTDRFNIDSGASMFVDGQLVDDENQVVRTGQSVEYLRHSGEKGSGGKGSGEKGSGEKGSGARLAA